MPLHVSSTCAHHQEVKIALHRLWYRHTYRWPSGAQFVGGLQSSLNLCTRRCDDTRGCVMQVWPPDDEHMRSKHVEAWSKLVVKQNFCASSWLITEINILRCTVSKTLDDVRVPDFHSLQHTFISGFRKEASPPCSCDWKAFTWMLK